MSRFLLRLIGSIFLCAMVWPSVATAEPVIAHPFKHYDLGELIRAAYSPTQSVAATVGPAGLTLWDSETGEIIWNRNDAMAESVAFSPDGSRVVSGDGDGVARVRDVATGELVLALEGHPLDIFHVAYSPDGTRIATDFRARLDNGDRSTDVRIWDASSGEAIATFETLWIADSRRFCFEFSPDGSRLLVVADRNFSLFDSTTGESIHSYETIEKNLCGKFSSDGAQILLGKENDLVELRNAQTGQLIQEFNSGLYRGHGVAVAMSHDGSLVLVGGGVDNVSLFDVATGDRLLFLRAHDEDVVAVGFSGDGSRFLSAGENWGRIWDTSTGSEVCNFEGHTTSVDSVAFSPDGTKVLTGCQLRGGADGFVARLRDASTGEILRAFRPERHGARHVAFSGDGRFIVTGGQTGGGSASRDAAVTVWHAETFEIVQHVEIVRRYNTPSMEVLDVALSPDGTMFMAGIGGQKEKSGIYLWDVSTGERITGIAGASGDIYTVAFSRDGRFILGGYNHRDPIWPHLDSGGLKVSDLATGEVVFSHSYRAPGWFGDAVFSPHGTQILHCGGRPLVYYPPAGGAYIEEISTDTRVFSVGLGATGTCVAYSPGGRHVAAGTSYVRLYDIATGEEVLQSHPNDGRLKSIAYSPDGTKILMGTSNGESAVIDVSQFTSLRTEANSPWQLYR